MDWFSQTWLFSGLMQPLFDILILAFLIFKSYQILVQTRAMQLLKGAVLMVLIYAVAFFLKLKTLLWVLNFLAPGLVIAVAIIFQPELRKIFTRIGQGGWFRLAQKTKTYHLDSVLNAVEILSGRNRGCLIVFVRNVGLKNIIETGTRLNADLTSSLILTIFSHDTPLHDGALVLQSGKIVSAGCFLPLSEQPDIRKSFGTRHRAALGLAEESDAVVVIVSEETGAVSLAYDGNLHYDLSIDEIRRKLKELLDFKDDVDDRAEEASHEI